MKRMNLFLPLLGTALLGGTALSQETTEIRNETEVTNETERKPERIQVTGSRIKQIDAQGPQPILVLDKDAIARTGATTINEALNTLTIASFGSANYGSGFGVGEGVQSISIHGLGSGNTLVLVNGKRLARDPYLEINDMSSIPVAAVERLEILKGTASAIYGSDALGGVVNIITRKDYEGLAVGASRTQPRYGGGDEDQLFVMSGTSTENSRNLTVLQYNRKSPTLYDDRPWYDDDWRSSIGITPSYRAKSGERSIWFAAGNECPSNGGAPTLVGGNTVCQWNHLPYLELEGKRDNLSILNDYAYDMNARTTLGVRLFANQTQVESGGAPQIFELDVNPALLGAGLTLAPDLNPDETVRVRGRLANGGNTVSLVSALTLSAQLLMTHEFANGDTIDFTVSDSRVNRNTKWNNRYDEVALYQALREGELTLFSPTTDDLADYKLDSANLNSSFTRTAEAVYSGDNDIFGYALGVGIVDEGYRNEVAQQTTAGRVLGLGGGSGAGTRTSRAIFGEANIPLGDVEIRTAARFDDYSDFGDTFNPQIGLVYRPVESVFLATNYGTGFKAPTLRDVNDDTARYFTSIQDVKRCNEAQAANDQDGIDNYCLERQGVETESGGNPDLRPETSTAYTATIGYEPRAGSGIQIEYYNTVIDDVITSPDADEMAAYEAAGRALPPGVILERDPLTGDLSRIVLPSTNLASRKTSGLDTRLYFAQPTSFGRFGYNTTYTYVLSYENKRSPDADYIEEIGTNGAPRWRWNNQFSYGVGRHSVSTTNVAIAGYEKNNPEFGDVGMHNQWDLNYKYTHAWKGDIEIGGRNIFNQIYPYDDSAGLSQGIGGSLYSIAGPTVYARYTQRF